MFQATASDVIAGQTYIGMLEGRVQEIVQRIRGRKVIWLLPGFEEAFWAGQHHQSPQGLLDALLPHVESGQIVVVGEIDPLAYELVAQLRPRVSRVFRVVRLAPMLEDEAVAVARDWADTAGVGVADGTIREALDLASHYLPGIAAPGSLTASWSWRPSGRSAPVRRPSSCGRSSRRWARRRGCRSTSSIPARSSTWGRSGASSPSASSASQRPWRCSSSGSRS